MIFLLLNHCLCWKFLQSKVLIKIFNLTIENNIMTICSVKKSLLISLHKCRFEFDCGYNYKQIQISNNKYSRYEYTLPVSTVNCANPSVSQSKSRTKLTQLVFFVTDESRSTCKADLSSSIWIWSKGDSWCISLYTFGIKF